MGRSKGILNGVGAIIGGLAGLAVSGYLGFVLGAMLGTIITDGLFLGTGRHVQTGRLTEILKGIAAAAGGFAGLTLGGFLGFVAGPLIGAIVGDILFGAKSRV